MTKANGFTLIELVVALAAASTLILVLASVTNGTVDRMRKVQGSSPVTDELVAAQILERMVDRASMNSQLQQTCTASELRFAAERPMAMGEGGAVLIDLSIREWEAGVGLVTAMFDEQGMLNEQELPLQFEDASFECQKDNLATGVSRLQSVTLRLKREASSRENRYRFAFPNFGARDGQQGAFSSQ